MNPNPDCLWGKWGSGNEPTLPLVGHLIDTAVIAGTLWDMWLPAATRRLCADAFGNRPDPDRDPGAHARAVLMWLAGVHDIGKADPIFQGQLLSPQSGRFAAFADGLRADGYAFPGDPGDPGNPRVNIPALAEPGNPDRPLFRHEVVTGAYSKVNKRRYVK